jgi:hypothetical protein
MQKHLTAREREMHSSSKKSHQYGMKSQPRGTSKRMNDTTGYESNPGGYHNLNNSDGEQDGYTEEAVPLRQLQFHQEKNAHD